MAQLVEHILGKDEVISSTLISSSKAPRAIALGDHYVALAQLDRVFGYEPKGRGFESLMPRKKPKCNSHFGFLYCKGVENPRAQCADQTHAVPSHSGWGSMFISFTTVVATSLIDASGRTLPSSKRGPQKKSGIVMSSGISVPCVRSCPP